MRAESNCDCCGRRLPDENLSPASTAPEMTVCAGCRHHLERESLDRSRGSASKLMRWLGDRVRGAVTNFGLHESLFGPLLRWIDRRSPW